MGQQICDAGRYERRGLGTVGAGRGATTPKPALLLPALVAAAVALSALAAPAAAATPTIAAAADTVTVGGLPANGGAVIFGVVREMRGAIVGQARWQGLLADADGDGVEIFGYDGRWARRSVWLAVDLGSGEWAVEPAGATSAVVPGAALTAPGVSAAEWTLPAGYRELLWVRPGESPGAWGAALGDGGAGDADGAVDGTVRVVAGLLEPVEGVAAAPESFAEGDLLLVVDPDSLGVEVLTVGGASPSAAAPGDGEAGSGEASR